MIEMDNKIVLTLTFHTNNRRGSGFIHVSPLGIQQTSATQSASPRAHAACRREATTTMMDLYGKRPVEPGLLRA